MIGIDIVDLRKFNRKMHIENIYTEIEINYSKSSPDPKRSLAGIFAAKEAILKAGHYKMYDLLRKNIEIRHENFIPKAYFKGKKLDMDISISHDGDYAIAVACKENSFDYEIDQSIKSLYKPRKSDGHKGDFGKIAIIGGSDGMAGSVYMSSMASLRAGAGLTYIITLKSISNILQIKCNEQIILPLSSNNYEFNSDLRDEILDYIDDKDVLAIGPGMGKSNDNLDIIRFIIKNTSSKIVIDADGLNAISYDLSAIHSDNTIVLTPHLAEFSRLCNKSIDEIKANKIMLAKNFAKENNVILVLKSDETIVTDGIMLYQNKIGNPGMATAGSGDVLTGIIASMLKIMDAFDACKFAVYIHSLAGDIGAKKLGEDSLLATDIINNIDEALKLMR